MVTQRADALLAAGADSPIVSRSVSALGWQQLEQRLVRRIETFDGVAGVCVRDLTTGDQIAHNGDVVFPTASTVKAHILACLLEQQQRGCVDLRQEVRFPRSACVGGSGVLHYLEGEPLLSLLDIAVLMITESDNSATNYLIDRLGFDAINAFIASQGLPGTALRRKMMDHPPAREHVENHSTPAELATFFAALHAGRPSPGVAEQALHILRKPKYGFLNRWLPAAVPIANKPGYSDRVRCDAALVSLERRPYVVAVMATLGREDAEALDGFVIDIGRTVYAVLAALDDSNDLGHAVYPGLP